MGRSLPISPKIAHEFNARQARTTLEIPPNPIPALLQEASCSFVRTRLEGHVRQFLAHGCRLCRQLG
ncbi:MAG: hypothetical protein OXF67_09815, partial [Cyanobacteria bacterium MAG CAR4_bin_6]|nr:hypothetical protein [Cyanobacteria bacterium MAG CAR4_bin_6]